MSESPATRLKFDGAPPYISFRTLLNLIERMATEGAPRRIDRSFLKGLSGGYQTQVLAALRSLGLIDDQGALQERLLDLIDHPNERGRIIGELLRDRYKAAADLGEENATQAELEELFKEHGIGGATLRKAVTFYLHAANFSGTSVSPFFTTPATTGETTTQRRRRARTARPTTPAAPVPPAETSPPRTPDDLRQRYIDMLLKKVEAQDEMDEKLLNRIETLLGYAERADEGEPED